MRAAERAHPDRVLVLDWARASAGHGGWFAGDGLHVNDAGAHAYANFVAAGLAPFLGPPHRGWRLHLPLRADAARATACGRIRAHGRRITVAITRGADRIGCRGARRLLRGPRLHPPRDWRYYDWRTVGRGPWTDVLARRDRAVVVAGSRPLSPHNRGHGPGARPRAPPARRRGLRRQQLERAHRPTRAARRDQRSRRRRPSAPSPPSAWTAGGCAR